MVKIKNQNSSVQSTSVQEASPVTESQKKRFYQLLTRISSQALESARDL